MTSEEHILLMFGMNLCKSDISNTIRTFVFDYLQKNKSIDNLNSIISTVEQIQSNFTSTQRVTSNSNNVRRTREENGFKSDEWGRECRLCESRHYYKKECKYSCKHCDMRGSHRSSECRGGRRKNNRDYNHGQNDRYRNSKVQDKRFRRSKSQDKSYKKAADRQGTPGKSLRIQTERDNGRESSPNSSPDDTHHRSHSNPPRHDMRDIDTRQNQNPSCNRVRRERTNSPNRRNLFGEHASLFDSIRMTPQQQHSRSSPWAGQQPPKRTCNRVKESRSNRKEEEKDETMTSHGAPTVLMPQHHLSYPRTYSEYKNKKRMRELANSERENEGRRTRSYSEESRPDPTSSHSHNNPA